MKPSKYFVLLLGVSCVLCAHVGQAEARRTHSFKGPAGILPVYMDPTAPAITIAFDSAIIETKKLTGWKVDVNVERGSDVVTLVPKTRDLKLINGYAIIVTRDYILTLVVRAPNKSKAADDVIVVQHKGVRYVFNQAVKAKTANNVKERDEQHRLAMREKDEKHRQAMRKKDEQHTAEMRKKDETHAKAMREKDERHAQEKREKDEQHTQNLAESIRRERLRRRVYPVAPGSRQQPDKTRATDSRVPNSGEPGDRTCQSAARFVALGQRANPPARAIHIQ